MTLQEYITLVADELNERAEPVTAEVVRNIIDEGAALMSREYAESCGMP